MINKITKGDMSMQIWTELKQELKEILGELKDALQPFSAWQWVLFMIGILGFGVAIWINELATASKW